MWYIDGAVYAPGNNLAQITVSFSTAGAHTVKVVADDHPYYANDAPVESNQITVQVMEYTYDKEGKRVTSVDSRGVTTYEYDVLGRLTKVTEPDGKWISYEYDGNNNRTKMTTHSDGTPSFNHVTQYEYNDRNLLSKVTDQLGGETTYTYKDNGQVDTITYPNLTKAICAYNGCRWLTGISNQKSGGAIIAQFDYTYDPAYGGLNGMRTSVVEDILKPDGTTRIKAQVEYRYDNLYRLIHEHRTAYDGGDPGVAYEYNYTYDDAGNRTAWQVVGGTTTTYTYDAANKMTSPGTFTCDVKGNITQIVSGITITNYTWDFLNRMTQWAKTGQTTEQYVYNAFGMRVRKTPAGGTATDFMLDGREIAEEIAGTDDTSYVGPRLTSQISGTTRIFHLADGIGTSRAISNGDTPLDVTRVGIHEGYGILLASSGDPSSLAFCAQSRYYTDATGLNYLKARYYDPTTGRFVSRDPIGYRGGLNVYSYAGANPIAHVDPLGLCFRSCWEDCMQQMNAPIIAGVGLVGGLVRFIGDSAGGKTGLPDNMGTYPLPLLCGAATGAAEGAYLGGRSW